MTEEIGSVLRSRRQQMGLSLEQVAEQTKIRKMHLHALEEELFDDLPGKVYVVGFLQNYARVLEIPAEPLLNALEERGYGKTKKEKLSQSSELMTATRTPSRKSPVRFLVWLILLLLILVAAWFYYFSPYLNEHKEQKETLTPGSPLSDTSRVQEGAEQPAAEPAAGQTETDHMAGAPATDGELAEQTEVPSVIPKEGGQ